MLPTNSTSRTGIARTMGSASRTRRPSLATYARAAISVLAATAFVACGESSNGGTTPPPPATVHAVRVAPDAPTTMIGQSVQLTATPVDAAGNPLDRPVTWQSLDPQVATVSATGQAIGVAAGQASIVATSGAVSGTVRITVNRQPVAAIILDKTELALDPAQTHQLVATVKDAAGADVTDKAVAWTTSNAQVATVDATGKVTAVAEGNATIAAAVDGIRAQLTVTVRPIPVARVVLSATHADLEPGEEVTIVARTEAADGTVLNGRLQFWGSSNPTVVVAQSNGRLRAQTTGEVTITVGSEGKVAQMTVTVHPSPARPLTFDRVSPNGNEIFIQEYSGAFTRLNAGNVSRHPSASPDGQRFVFAVTQRDLTTNQMIHDLFVVDRNGMNIRHLTKMAGVETEPVWSPDGTKIAFSGTEAAGSAQDIFVVNVDGSGIANLTADMPFTYEQSPAWSPDGHRLAFASMNLLGHTHIYTMNADGTGRARLTNGTMDSASHPTWSPDGGRIAFSRWYQGSGADVVIIPRTGGAELRLAVAGDQTEPVWSPNGAHFAFTTQVGDVQQVATMRVDGTSVRLRAPGRNPAWLLR